MGVFSENPLLTHNQITIFLYTLKLSSSFLASLELLQVVFTHLEVTLVIIQAPCEVSGIGRAGSRSLLFLGILLRSNLLLLLLGFSWSRTSTSKDGTQSCTNGVADTGSNCNTSCGGSHLGKHTGLFSLSWSGWVSCWSLMLSSHWWSSLSVG